MTAQFTASERTLDSGHQVVELRHRASGAWACIVPGLGGNCLQLALPPKPGADAIPLIDDLALIEQLETSPNRYGIPVLFPWPSGIPGGVFRFQDGTINLNSGDEITTYHHVFVNTASWTVMEVGADDARAWLTAEIKSEQCGVLAARFGWPCTLRITWTLLTDRLNIDMTVTNRGDSAMPMGLGLHPYFSLPFGSRGSRAECRLKADVGRQWDLGATCELSPADAAPADPFLPECTFPAGAVMGGALHEIAFNHVYQARFKDGQQTLAAVIDPANGIRLTVRGSRDFGTWVFYTPPDRDAISLEPWTLAANGFNLAAAGIEEAGLVTLAPGASWTGNVTIQCEEI